MWYELGSNFLSDDLRGDALIDHVMRLTKTQLTASTDDDDNVEFDDNQDDDESFQTRMMDVDTAGILDKGTKYTRTFAAVKVSRCPGAGFPRFHFNPPPLYLHV